MHKINRALAELGVRPPPEPTKTAMRRERPPYTKTPGESKAARRMRRRAAYVG